MLSPDTIINRPPAVAGQFYPKNSVELSQLLQTLYKNTPASEDAPEVVALISPHAGYIYSGEVAAAAFNQLNPEKEYKTIFVIGSSHHHSFPGASVYHCGHYQTPLGTVSTDLEIAQKLVNTITLMAFSPQYHELEHCIEVQLPFLQFYLKKDFKIVPILLGTHNPEICRNIAEALKPYFTPDNLFVISTDFSHYPPYDEAVTIDKQVADAIVTNNPDKFRYSIEHCTNTKYENLSTACCSWPAVLTLLYLTQHMTDLFYKKLRYKNSGDSPYGSLDRVVGYYALSVMRNKHSVMGFENQAREELLQIARSSIETYLNAGHIPDLVPDLLPTVLRTKSGAFVTLKKNDDLRGCIGVFDAGDELYKTVQQMAVAAATRDYRFSSVSADEMKLIDIEISVLTPMQKITDTNSIRLGIDGIYIKKGNRSSTFLPQVATETGWNLEEFLGHCARDKAGIGWDGWKDKEVELFVYQSVVFGEKK